MKGGIAHPSTLALMSSRGLETLKTFSSFESVPFSPLACSILVVSRLADATFAAAARPATEVRSQANVS
jgi:hypothetical protein